MQAERTDRSASLTGPEDYIRAVTEFIFVAHEPEMCDVIFVPGANPLHTAHVDQAAAMYRAGWAPYVLPSGRYSVRRDSLPYGDGFETEWAWMRHRLMAQGVPDSAILREDEATYTWENAQYSRRVTDALGIRVRRGMLCCRSFHARRALLYYQAAYPDTVWRVCPGEEEGLTCRDWFLTLEGRARILGEVRRLGDQVNEVFEGMIRSWCE